MPSVVNGLVVIAQYVEPFEADVVVARLRDEGIDSTTTFDPHTASTDVVLSATADPRRRSNFSSGPRTATKRWRCWPATSSICPSTFTWWRSSPGRKALSLAALVLIVAALVVTRPF